MTKFDYPPRILFLYGSLRDRFYSRLLAEEAARIIEEFGTEIKFFDSRELPIYGSVSDTGIMKNQTDWIPLNLGAVRPTQGRTLAVVQVSGGSQSLLPSIRCDF